MVRRGCPMTRGPGGRCTAGSLDTRPAGWSCSADGSHRAGSAARISCLRRSRRRCSNCVAGGRTGALRGWVLELARASGGCRLPSELAVYRCLVRAGVIDPVQRHRKLEPLEALGAGRAHGAVAGGRGGRSLLLADGTTAKVLTGVDDHSRYCVSVRCHAARANPAGLRRARGLRCGAYGVPQQVLTDTARSSPARFCLRPPVEVLFDRICRENGVEPSAHRSRDLPPLTGKIERFHRTMRLEFDTSPGVPQL